MILPNDILIRETTDGKTVWVSQRLVVDLCGVGEDSLRKELRTRYKRSLPDSWQRVASQPEFFLGYKAGRSWRWGRRNGQYYYDIDTIPNRQPTCYRDRLPSKEELIARVDEHRLRGSRDRQASLSALITQAAAEYYSKDDVRWLHTASGMGVDIATCRDYGRALSWCRFITVVDSTHSYERFGITMQYLFHDAVADILSRQKIASLRVSTGESLRQKLRGFPSDVDDQRRWIISGKYGNTNRKIVGKYQIVSTVTGEILELDIHQAVMFNAYMNLGDPRKEYKSTLYNEAYVPMMEAFGGTPVALRSFNKTLSNFANRLKGDLHRHGQAWYKKQLLTYIPSDDLTYAHTLFCGDGSGLISYRYWTRTYNSDKEKWEQELRLMNIYAVLISDVASGYIAGYAFSPEGTHGESPEMVQSAVRMAVAEGGNQTMFEFVSDNYGSFTRNSSKELLREVFNYVRTIEPGNSQGNPAEVQFRLFKNSTLRCLKNFVRSSHNAQGIEGRANVEAMKKEDYPLYAEAVEQTIAAIERWNNTPRGNEKTPAEMFHGEKHPKCQPLPAIQLRNIFGHRTHVEISRMRGFVDVTHAGAKHKFTIPDYHDSGAQKISRATGNGYDAVVYVHWDATGADLYSSDGKYILTCPPTVKASKGYAERTPEQLAAQRELRARKQQQFDAAVEFGDKVQYAMDVITESNGYEVDVHFGGGKESTNEHYENEINEMIPSGTSKGRKADDATPPPTAPMSEIDRMIYGV